MRILVTGSRDWDQRETIISAISAAYLEDWDDAPEDVSMTLVHGACPTGADAIADEFASLGADVAPNHWTVERHPADWETHGKRAGFLRNKEMVDLGADICLAFIKNHSKGATMTLDLAKKAGIPTRVYRA